MRIICNYCRRSHWLCSRMVSLATKFNKDYCHYQVVKAITKSPITSHQQNKKNRTLTNNNNNPPLTPNNPITSYWTFTNNKIWHGFYVCYITLSNFKDNLVRVILVRWKIGRNMFRWKQISRIKRINSNNKINRIISNNNNYYNNNSWTRRINNHNEISWVINKEYSHSFLTKSSQLILNYNNNSL